MKTVLITGASGNLGKVVVEKFIQNDFQILATVSPGKKWEGILNKRIHLVEVELTEEESVIKAVSKITSDFSIQAAFFLAGGYASGDVHSIRKDDIQKMMATNFETALYISRTIFDHMLERKEGRLIFVGARPAISASHGQHSVAYGLSKAMIMKWAEYLNATGADQNVLSHVIVPSTIDTPANRAAMPQSDFSSWVRPEDIAETLLFLCSPSSTAFRDTVIKMYNRS